MQLIAYIPFRNPLPLYDYWPWMIIPLCLAVAIVYKTVRASSFETLARDSIVTAVWILAGLAGGAAALAAIVSLVH